MKTDKQTDKQTDVRKNNNNPPFTISSFSLLYLFPFFGIKVKVHQFSFVVVVVVFVVVVVVIRRTSAFDRVCLPKQLSTTFPSHISLRTF